MKVISQKSRHLPLVAVAVLGLLSSCNRGVGCPTNFSLNEFLEGGVTSLLGLFF